MQYKHIQRIVKSPIYVYCLQHRCPQCNSKLVKVKVSKIVNSNSPEAKEFDFETLDNCMIGDVKFVWTEFHCSNCKINITVDEMKQIEKRKRVCAREK